jgi:membrane-bound metal-dependent hydrolase YbcI (DUF457 family)
MKTVTKVAEIISGLLLVLFAFSTRHRELTDILLSLIEAFAAFFVAWAFPSRPAARPVALVLAAAVVSTALLRTIVNGFGVPNIDSPVVGFALLPGALLVLAQLVAAYAVLRHRKPAD